MKNIRRSIYQGMVSFIEQTTMYDLEDVARVIQEPYENINYIMQGRAFPVNRNAELNLAELYAISLDLHYFYQKNGKK